MTIVNLEVHILVGGGTRCLLVGGRTPLLRYCSVWMFASPQPHTFSPAHATKAEPMYTCSSSTIWLGTTIVILDTAEVVVCCRRPLALALANHGPEHVPSTRSLRNYQITKIDCVERVNVR